MTNLTKSTFWARPTFYKFSYCLILCLGLVLISSCNDGEEDITIAPIPIPSTETSIAEILTAMGEENILKAAATISYSIEGSSFEFEEEEPDQPNPIKLNDYKINLSSALADRKLRLEYTYLNTEYPVAFSSEGALLIINDQKGSVSGKYSVVSNYFGAILPTGLHSSRIESSLKTYAMSNPLELIRAYLKTNNDVAATTQNNVLKIPTIIDGLDIELLIDKDTNLPTTAQVKESDFLHGDVLFQVNYDNWEQFTNIKFPKTLEHFYNGEKVKTETISDLTLDGLDDPAILFATETVAAPIPYDEDLGKKGVYHSQWYSRLFNAGIPMDPSLTIGFVAAANDWTPFGIPDQTIGDKVKIIGRPDLLYWSLAIKTSEGVVIVDAPVHQEWCNSIINAVKSPDGFPDTDITGVIVTHDHFDHFGGIRALANEAGKVYVNSDGVNGLQSILDATHALVPDALSSNTNPITIEQVNDVTLLDNGAVEIHNVNMSATEDNPHSDNMLIVYVPEYELVIQADLFNAGAMLALYAGQGVEPLSAVSKSTWNKRAKFLMNYITEKELTVSKVVGMHGGLGSMAQLQFVAQ